MRLLNQYGALPNSYSWDVTSVDVCGLSRRLLFDIPTEAYGDIDVG